MCIRDREDPKDLLQFKKTDDRRTSTKPKSTRKTVWTRLVRFRRIEDDWIYPEEEDGITGASAEKDVYKRQMLNHPDFNRPFYMNCDASDISLGSVLYQEDKDGNHQVISFASRMLNQCERNYHVTEKELLSVVFSCLLYTSRCV